MYNKIIHLSNKSQKLPIEALNLHRRQQYYKKFPRGDFGESPLKRKSTVFLSTKARLPGLIFMSCSHPGFGITHITSERSNADISRR